MSNIVKVHPHTPERRVIEAAAEILCKGGLVAFPTETVYGLGALALNPHAVRKIFTAKDRPDWDPLIVHVRDLPMAHALMKRLQPQFELLVSRFWPGPLTLVVEKAAQVPDEVTAGRPNVALRMPWHPVAAALLDITGAPVAAPSANRFGRPSPTRAEHVTEDLGDRVDMILDAGPTPMGVESTVLDLTQSPVKILRPGGVSREQLEKVIGAVQLATGIGDEAAQAGLAGPGMTLKHYAPRAAVELFENAEEIHARADKLRAQGKRVAVLDTASTIERLAQTVFAQLRDLDTQGIEIILCHLPPPQGLGLAVRDRLLRAAGKGGQT